MKSAPESESEEVSLLLSSLDNWSFFLVVIPILLTLLYFEHRRQLKKFKKVWKDRLETGLSSLKDSHRKRLSEFRVQPVAMKAEWSSLKSQMEKRMDEFRSLKIEVNSQLTSLKLDFQRQSAHCLSQDRPSALSLPTHSYLDCKFHSLKAYVDQQIAHTKHLHEVTAKLLQVSVTAD